MRSPPLLCFWRWTVSPSGWAKVEACRLSGLHGFQSFVDSIGPILPYSLGRLANPLKGVISIAFCLGHLSPILCSRWSPSLFLLPHDVTARFRGFPSLSDSDRWCRKKSFQQFAFPGVCRRRCRSSFSFLLPQQFAP